MIADKNGAKILLAIPCYNCEKQITRVLSAIDASKVAVHEIWVVDNGSIDSTVSAAESAKKYLPNLRIFVNTENISLGGTHKVVFQQAISNGFTHVVILHGDDQASTHEIQGLVTASISSGGKSVLGSRVMTGSQLQGYDIKRIVGNRALNFIYSIFARRNLTDLGSGLNLFRVGDLSSETYLQFGNTLSFNYELILDLVRRRVPFIYFPISWREEDQTSNARNLKIFSEAIRILVRWVRRRPTSKTQLSGKNYSWTEVKS
jgi:glycosyltransferase involved in cell wall biosynthesis